MSVANVKLEYLVSVPSREYLILSNLNLAADYILLSRLARTTWQSTTLLFTTPI